MLNRSEDEAGQPMPEPLAKRLTALSAAGLVLSASVEAEIAQLDPADQAAFLADLGLAESARARFVRTAYELLDLISFFTVGEDEVRAWPIRARDPRAGGGREDPLRPRARLHPGGGDGVPRTSSRSARSTR